MKLPRFALINWLLESVWPQHWDGSGGRRRGAEKERADVFLFSLPLRQEANSNCLGHRVLSFNRMTKSRSCFMSHGEIAFWGKARLKDPLFGVGDVKKGT